MLGVVALLALSVPVYGGVLTPRQVLNISGNAEGGVIESELPLPCLVGCQEPFMAFT